MSKQYNIRWSDNDSKELARAVKNFNAKVKRLETKYQGTDIVIPEKVTVKEMRELIGTRRDLQREIKSLQRFTQRGAEEIVTAPISENDIQMTKWQRTEMNRRRATINTQRSRRLEQVQDIQMMSGGKELGYTVGDIGMGKAEEVSLKPINSFTPKMTKYDVKEKFRALRKHSQSDYFKKSDQRLLNNFTRAIEETYGVEDSKEIVEAIEKMDFKEFYGKFMSDPGAFEFAYPPSDEEKQKYLEHLKSTWIPETRKK